MKKHTKDPSKKNDKKPTDWDVDWKGLFWFSAGSIPAAIATYGATIWASALVSLGSGLVARGVAKGSLFDFSGLFSRSSNESQRRYYSDSDSDDDRKRHIQHK